MSTFIGRNKRKSGWAAVLLWLLRRGKLAVPLLLAAILAGSAVLSYTGPLGQYAWVRRTAAAFHMEGWLDASDRLALGRLKGVLRGMRRGYGEASSSAFYRIQSSAYRNPNVDSAALVTGGAALVRHGGPINLRDAQSVDGVLRPEDAARSGRGVPLSEKELREGLLANAMAGRFSGNGPAVGKDWAGGRYLGVGWPGMGSPGPGAGSPGVLTGGLPIRGVASAGVLGHLGGAFDWGRAGAKVRGGSGGLTPYKDKSNIYGLYVTNMLGCMASSGGGPSAPDYWKCPSGPPPRLEFSEHTMDISYSGSDQGGLGLLEAGVFDIGAAASLGGIGVAQAQADQQSQDLQTCTNAMQSNAPAMAAAMNNIVQHCEHYNSIQCGSCCGCSWHSPWCCFMAMFWGSGCSNCNYDLSQIANSTNRMNTAFSPTVALACSNVGMSAPSVGGGSVGGASCP